MSDTNEARNAIVGMPSGGVSNPKATPTGDGLPSGKVPAGAGSPNPRGKPPQPGGMPNKPGNPGTGGGMGAPPPMPGTPGAPPPSKFAGNNPIPEISVEPVKHPDDHKHDKTCAAEGDHIITAEFCLEQMARVLMEIAEQQEDPVWVESHRTLGEMWFTAAQALLQFRIDAQANAGEVELKQQQLYQQDELHQQTLAQNDQVHAQGMQHTDDAHKQMMAQKDEQHKVGLDATNQQNKFKMDTAGQMHKQKMTTQQKADQITLQKKQQAAKPAPKSSSSK